MSRTINWWVGVLILDVAPNLMLITSASALVLWLFTGWVHNPAYSAMMAIGGVWLVLIGVTFVAWIIGDTIQAIRASPE